MFNLFMFKMLLYNNPGGKLKLLVKVLTALITIFLCVMGVLAIRRGETLFGILFLIFSFPVSYIVFLPLIAFGQLCEDISVIRKKVAPDEKIKID